MGKSFVFHLLVLSICSLMVVHCSATLYTVGDTSGWDISTDLGTWSQGKTFAVGDVLVFQYSSIYSVVELTKPKFDSCNTTDAIRTYSSSGNTTVTLNKPGDWYFADGNKLYCLGGMKLHVHVVSNQTAATPAGSPQAAAPPSAELPRTSRTNLPTSQGARSVDRFHPAVTNLALLLIGFVGYVLT